MIAPNNVTTYEVKYYSTSIKIFNFSHGFISSMDSLIQLLSCLTVQNHMPKANEQFERLKNGRFQQLIFNFNNS